MGIITVSLGFYELQTKKAQGSTLQAIKMLHKPKSDRDLIHSVTHIVGLGGSAVSRANKKISIVMTIINEQSLSASPPTSDLGNLGCCSDTWKLPAPMIQLQRINHFLMPKSFPFSISLGTVYNHPASQGSLLLRGGTMLVQPQRRCCLGFVGSCLKPFTKGIFLLGIYGPYKKRT